MKKFEIGSKVVCASVDEFGFCGRDNHPSKADIGKTFIVVHVEDVTDEGMTPELMSELEESGEDPTLLCVRACSPEGDVREFMDFELKA